MLMMQTEVGEAFEPYQEGRGSSSTMPQKRNPIACEFILALAKVVRQQAGLMLDGMAADHRARYRSRGSSSGWPVPEAFVAQRRPAPRAVDLEASSSSPSACAATSDLTGG
jgi:3-carboxy-cis,cis-muconate cycloisomerase